MQTTQMKITHMPQPSPTAICRSRQCAGRYARLLIAYLFILTVVITGMTVTVYGRNRHHERTRTAATQISRAGETTPASSTEGNPTEDGEEDESPSLPSEEENHESTGDDVIVRIER